MNDSVGAESDVAKLEAAALLILAAPSEVRAEDRKAAESMFLSLRQSKLSPQICRFILESSHNDFVLFEIAQIMGSSILKDWSVIEASVVEESYKYLLQYAVQRPGLVNFVRAEIFRSCAKLMKRGIFDRKVGETDMLYSTIENLLTSEDLRMQSLGCEMVVTIAVEFSSSWRTSNLGITWDFHLRAKRAFEAVGLRRLFQLSLQTLHQIVNASDISSPYYRSLCEKLLCVAETVLSWNFSSRLLPPRLIYCTEMGGGAALRPHSSWRDIFQNDQLLNLFFQLHTRVRDVDSLREHSINCLVQLSSLMGEVLMKRNTDVNDPSDHYLTVFIQNFLEVFKSGPLESEVSGFSAIVHKLFTFHKISSFLRIDQTLFTTYLTFIVQYVEHFTPIAMQKAFEDEEHSYSDALVQLYGGWLVLVRGAERANVTVSLKEPTFAILSSFIRSVFSPPVGNRRLMSNKECIDEHEQDDRELFGEMLIHIGHFAVYCFEQFAPMLASLFEEKLTQFNGFLNCPVNDEEMDVWREDLHWLLLLVGFTFTSEDVDGSCHVPGDVYEYSVQSCKHGVSTPSVSVPFLRACIQTPRTLPDRSNVDILIQFTGMTFAWCSLEHSMLSEGGGGVLSPELSRSSLWCLRRLVSALSVQPDSEDEDKEFLPQLELHTDFSRLVVEFALQKCFTIFNKLSGEAKLCADAVNLLVGLVDSRAGEMASNELLFTCLSTVQLDKLPSRRALLQALVLIGAAAEDKDLQEKMYLMILQPLSEKFSLVATTSGRESDIADLLDCFYGVAHSAQQHSAHVLFRFLSPILTQCVSVLSSRKDSQLLTNSILELFNVVTRKLAIYVEEQEDSILLYRILLDLLTVYQRDQLCKYNLVEVDEEEKAVDLILILDILANVMSKDVLLTAAFSETDAISSGSQVAFMGLGMLIPLMEEQLLKLPQLCIKFYRLILYSTEMAPECVGLMSEGMITSIIECLRVGLQSHFGQEVATVSAETVNQIATFFAQQEHPNENIVARLSTLIEPTFGMCLEVSCLMDIFNEATYALYALICCNKGAFTAFVEYLLNREQNAVVRTQLEGAFNTLLSGEQLNAIRKEKREFRDRFEKFLNNIQGLLVID